VVLQLTSCFRHDDVAILPKSHRQFRAPTNSPVQSLHARAGKKSKKYQKPTVVIIRNSGRKLSHKIPLPQVALKLPYRNGRKRPKQQPTMTFTMIKTALSPVLRRAKTSATGKAYTSTAMRSITIGTDMLSTVISLQKARPWYMTPEQGSNKGVDNAVTLQDLFANKTVAVFGVPAPFTGTCSNEHYPAYKKLAGELRQAGIQEIVCFAVSDPYAHHAWQQALLKHDGGNNSDSEEITFLADVDADFARGYGVDTQYTECSLGLRSKRFSMIVTDGVVSTFRLVEDAAGDAEVMLADLKEINENNDE
jgi:peroxiredoxin